MKWGLFSPQISILDNTSLLKSSIKILHIPNRHWFCLCLVISLIYPNINWNWFCEESQLTILWYYLFTWEKKKRKKSQELLGKPFLILESIKQSDYKQAFNHNRFSWETKFAANLSVRLYLNKMLSLYSRILLLWLLPSYKPIFWGCLISCFVETSPGSSSWHLIMFRILPEINLLYFSY